LSVSVTDANRRDPTQVNEKLKAHIEDVRDTALGPVTRKAKGVVEGFLAEQQSRIGGALRTMLEKASRAGKAKESRAAAIKADEWWDVTYEDARLSELMGSVYAEVGRHGLQGVSSELNRFIRPGQIDPVIADLLESGGTRIADINAKTRKALDETLAEGTRRGYSINQLIEGVPADGYLGVKGVTLDNGLPAFGDLRAETIARTETMLSYNRATVTGYGTFGVERLLAYDGDGDAECAARNGQDFPIDEALNITDHPNGTLVWSPLFKAADDRDDRMLALATKALDVATQQRTPDVHVHNEVTPPDVHVEMAPITVPINVQPTEVTIPPVVVNVDANRPTTKTVERDPQGQIIRITETPDGD
jgi:hypothetical protein